MAGTLIRGLLVAVIAGSALYTLWQATRSDGPLHTRALLHRGRKLTKGADGRWDQTLQTRLTRHQEDAWADTVADYYNWPSEAAQQTGWFPWEH